METPVEPATPPLAPPTRGGRSARGMALALAILLVPVFLLLALYRLVGNEDPIVVDAAPAYDAARAAKAFEVLEPRGLGDDWIVQSATFRLGVLRIGMLTPREDGLQIMQTNQPADAFVPAQLGQGLAREGTADVAGRTWQWYKAGRPGERALVLAESGRTVVVLGNASEDELRQAAGALR